MTVESVIFDWGGTLTPWHTIDPYECWLTVTADPAQARALHEAETAVWTLARDEHRSATVEEVIDAAAATLTPEQRRAYYAWWDDHSYTDPAAPAVLQALRERGLKIGILSNTIWPRVEHERIFTRDGVSALIDGAVYSSEIAWTKPHPKAFEAAMAAVGVSDPALAVFVGDRLFDDIFGAQRVGMRAVHIPHSQIPAWQTTGVEGSPDAVIGELGDLVAVIDGWLD
jgi:putative hydrolase of the HAD superfamily